MGTNEPILLRLNRLYFFKCAVAKKKKRKRMIVQKLNWKRSVVLAYNSLIAAMNKKCLKHNILNQ
jgi:hypothetical protein